jgi:YidC/Oxa1 family membrane protein insertase
MQKNTVIFLISSFLILIGWMALERWLHPPQPPKPKTPPTAQAKKEEAPEAKQEANKPAAKAPGGGALAFEPPPPARQHGLITLGNDSSHLKVTLDPRGGGVRQVICNQFEAADAAGRPLPGQKLELVPEEENRDEPSNLLFHYLKSDPERPVDTLGREEWTPHVVVPDEQVAFVYDKLPDVILTKTYTLKPGDYHVQLDVKVERKVLPAAFIPTLQILPQPDVFSFVGQGFALAGKPNTDPVTFQYQVSSAHGLPIEGKWYTTTFRNALVGQVDKDGYFWRNMQDLHAISHGLGGDPVLREEGKAIEYGGVTVQYFASVVVVSDKQPQRNFLIRAQPMIETIAVRGRIKTIWPSLDSFELLGSDRMNHIFFVPKNTDAQITLAGCQPGQEVVVRAKLADVGTVGVAHTATEILTGKDAEQIFFDDISVRLITEPFTVKAGAPVVHSYLLYNGPVKVRLLADRGVPQDEVDYYNDTLGLSTLTDYHSNGWAGSFASKIYWSALLIKCTNLMHWVLGHVHRWVFWDTSWSWGLCIIVLTVMVRGAMFPVSRKQALTTMKMQTLAPELKKIQEKYKNDRQALGMAQMELYRKHGINPLGSCWLLLLQMPIFLGLYYALQESIDFRLSPFLWIKNLAAPDMLIPWGSSIPWISRPEDYGSFLFLGPYFNLLPVLAVALMIVQQAYLMPPPADEQQEMQQKMMKYMMVFFGFMFYKVAAGLCIYFIASSLWGFAERKLLPKRKAAPGEAPPVPPANAGLFQKALQRLEAVRGQPPVPAVGASVRDTPAAAPTTGSRRKKRRKAGRERTADGVGTTGGEASQAVRSWWDGVREWWTEVLKKAEKR